MRRSTEPEAWVVYRALVRGKPEGMIAVCPQDEWEAMQRAQPGHHTLIRDGITNEGEAERLARGGAVLDSGKKPPKSTVPPTT